jgi:regulator of protease activity HflC (stomatin/prohibitin superfamily)
MGILGFLFFLGFLVVAAYKASSFSHVDGEKHLEIKISKGLPWLALALILGIGLPILGSAFVSVDAGEIGVVKHFGAVSRELSPGLHVITPFADSVTPVTIQTRIVKPNESTGTHDLQQVYFEVTMAYHVDPEYASFVLTKLNNDAEARVITPAILEAIKATTAQYDAPELLTKRPEVRDKIETFVKARIAPEHIIAEQVSITNFSFSNTYEEAVEAKVTAEQNALKADNDLKRIKIEAQQQVAQAQGEADALKAQKEQITPELLQLRTIEMMKEKWDGQLPTVIVGGNQALPMMDVLNAAKSLPHHQNQ